MAFEALLIKLALLKLVLSNCVALFIRDTLVVFKKLSILMNVLLFKSLRGKEVTWGCELLLLLKLLLLLLLLLWMKVFECDCNNDWAEWDENLLSGLGFNIELKFKLLLACWWLFKFVNELFLLWFWFCWNELLLLLLPKRPSLLWRESTTDPVDPARKNWFLLSFYFF